MQKKKECTQKKEPMSKIRKAYIARLVGRCIVFVIAVVLYILKPESMNVLH